MEGEGEGGRGMAMGGERESVREGDGKSWLQKVNLQCVSGDDF